MQLRKWAKKVVVFSCALSMVFYSLFIALPPQFAEAGTPPTAAITYSTDGGSTWASTASVKNGTTLRVIHFF